MALRSRCIASWTFALALVAGCAGPSLRRAVSIEPGERTRVMLTQVNGNQQFVLQNESSGSAESVYRDAKANPLLKVCDDDDLQALLDVLAEKGMFDQASAQPAPDARDVLSVDSGGRQFHWSRRVFGLTEGELPFHEAKAYFLALYNQTVAWHQRPVDKRTLQSEQERVDLDGAAARARLQKIQNGKGNSK